MKEGCTVALFGEAEKGKFSKAYLLDEVEQLLDYLGNPPPESSGLFLAVQALMFKRQLIFFRVREEGFSYQDYLFGLKLLEKEGLCSNISALCMPGVGDSEIIEAATPLCRAHQSIILTTEPDFYDYLTA